MDTSKHCWYQVTECQRLQSLAKAEAEATVLKNLVHSWRKGKPPHLRSAHSTRSFLLCAAWLPRRRLDPILLVAAQGHSGTHDAHFRGAVEGVRD
jgi:hypothetical protein